MNIFGQAGAKFATNGNALSAGDFLGSTNNQALIFKTNNQINATLNPSGVFQINNLAGTGNRFLQSDAMGNILAFPAGNASQVLYGDGTWGDLPASSQQYWQGVQHGIAPLSLNTWVGIGLV